MFPYYYIVGGNIQQFYQLAKILGANKGHLNVTRNICLSLLLSYCTSTDLIYFKICANDDFQATCAHNNFELNVSHCKTMKWHPNNRTTNTVSMCVIVNYIVFHMDNDIR